MAFLHEKGAVRHLSREEAARVRREEPHRIMGSRHVWSKRLGDLGLEEFKARWCVRGDQDPDVMRLAFEWLCSSPTMSVAGKALVLQLLASFGWDLELGDVKGAF